MNALLKGYIAIIWEAISSYGMDFVKEQWTRLIESDERPIESHVEYVSDILSKFEKALKDAKT